MEDVSKKYPEYDEMDEQQLDDEYNILSKKRLDLLKDDIEIEHNEFVDVKERMDYIDNIRNQKFKETTFTFPELPADNINIEKNPESKKEFSIEDFIRRNYDGTFKLDKKRNDKALELIKNTYKSNNNNIKFKPLTSRNIRGTKQIVLKRNEKGKLKYNKSKIASEAVKQFKKLINEVTEEQKDIDKTIDNMLMVDTNVDSTPNMGLTEKENRELEGVLKPPETIDMSTRPKFLKVQTDYIHDTLDKTIEERDNTNNPEEYIELEGRVIDLWKARDKTLEQIQLEEVREQQEEDISRLQRFKEWEKENMVGLSALSVSIAGIITTIIVASRWVLVEGGEATGKFAKALYNFGKKLGGLIAPLLNILAQVISLGAKGLIWLASNLWALVIAFTLYIYNQYKNWKK